LGKDEETGEGETWREGEIGKKSEFRRQNRVVDRELYSTHYY